MTYFHRNKSEPSGLEHGKRGNPGWLKWGRKAAVTGSIVQKKEKKKNPEGGLGLGAVGCLFYFSTLTMWIFGWIWTWTDCSQVRGHTGDEEVWLELEEVSGLDSLNGSIISADPFFSLPSSNGITLHFSVELLMTWWLAKTHSSRTPFKVLVCLLLYFSISCKQF